MSAGRRSASSGRSSLTATVGALIALPTLRLSGIYLALATAAFAVFLDRWIFGLPPFNLPFTDVKISIFGTGSLTVARLKLFGYAFDTEYRQLMLLATTFALLAIFVVVAAARRVRPAPARDEGQPRRVRHGRDEPHVHEARGVRDLGGHRRASAAR